MYERNVNEVLGQWFEDALEIKRSRTAFAAPTLQSKALDLSPRNAALNLGPLRKFDPTLKVKAGFGHTTHLITSRKAMVITGIDLLKATHPGHNLRMTEDILSFEPDEDLINMSENPLWIIQPQSEFAVAIKRIF